METSTSTPLSDLRKQMSSLGIDAFVVGSGDAHQSEYVHESDKRRTFISKFTGSAGTALILQTSALLWTDGRYFLQATMELSDEWTLMRSGNPGVLELNEWIAGNLPAGSIVAIDSFLVSTSQAKAMEKAFGGKQITLRGLDRNPIDEIWADRPLPPAGSVQCHDIALAGKTHVEKISEVQKSLEKNFSTAVIVSMLDEVSTWPLLSHTAIENSHLMTLTHELTFFSSKKIIAKIISKNPLRHLIIFLVAFCRSRGCSTSGDPMWNSIQW